MLSCGSLFSDRRPTLVVMSDVTQLLSAIDAGDPKAADQLLPLVYEELRKLAAAKMAQEQPGQTLQPTALVHEVWLRLVGDESARFEGRGHFFAAAKRQDAPEQGFWLTLDADGENLPSDWYLKLSGEITKRYHGEPGSPDFPLTIPKKSER